MLRSFSQDDRDHMVENGVISVTCEFCSANYKFAPEDVAGEPIDEPGLQSGLGAGLPPAVAAAVALSLLLTPEMARAQSCPAPLADARRLVLVTAETMTRHGATHAAL